jgi:L-serine dehydratase
MAAGGLVTIFDGTPAQVEMAAEIALEHHLGLPCDPVGGLVQIPCIERSVMGTVKALTAATLALGSNGKHTVSLDEAIEAMAEIGRDMSPKYKETSRGGLALACRCCKGTRC